MASDAQAIATMLGGTKATRDGRGWKTLCPCHDDAPNPSLSLTDGDDGVLLVHCWGGCDSVAVLRALRDMGCDTGGRRGYVNGHHAAPEPPRATRAMPAHTHASEPPAPWGRPQRAVYDYRDAAGNVLYRKVRFDDDPKPKMGQCTPAPDQPSGWSWSREALRGQPAVLYNLPGILASAAAGNAVILCEGEHDAQTLIQAGIVATTVRDGAGSKPSAELLAPLAGRRVIVVGDNDEAGRKYAAAMPLYLRGIAKDVRVIDLPVTGPGEDVTDWFERYGGTRAAFVDLCRAAPVWVPGDAVADDQGGESPPAMALTEVPLDDLMQVEVEPPRFAVEPWIPLRHVTLFGGHGGTGKSSIALVIAAHVACGRPFAGLPVRQLPVLFASLEDEPNIVLWRLKRIIQAYSLPPEEIIRNVRLLDGTQSASVLFAEESFGLSRPTAAYQELAEQARGAGLIVIDNASDAFDANENHRRAVRSFVRALAVIAQTNDAAVVLLAHIDKQAAKFGAQGNTYSGSTAWHNSARSRLALTEDDGALTLTHEKLNLGRRAEPVEFAFDGAVPMIRATGVEVVTDTANTMIREDAIIAAIRAAESAGICVPSRTVAGNASAQATLAPFPEYAGVFGVKNGAALAAKTITAMLRSGRLAVVQHQKPNRHTVEKLVISSGQG